MKDFFKTQYAERIGKPCYLSVRTVDTFNLDELNSDYFLVDIMHDPTDNVYKAMVGREYCGLLEYELVNLMEIVFSKEEQKTNISDIKCIYGDDREEIF